MSAAPSNSPQNDDELASPRAPGYSSKVTRRRRISLIVAGAVVALLGTAVAVAVPMVKTKVRSEILRRCTASVGGTCDVGAIELGSDGAMISNVRVRNTATNASATVGHIAVSFRWWPLVWGSQQGISVRVRDVTVDSDAPLDDVIAEVRRVRAVRGPRNETPTHDRRIRLDRLVVERVGGRVRVASLSVILSTVVIYARVENASLDWGRGGPILLRWDNLSVNRPLRDDWRSEICTIRKDPNDRYLHVTCERFRTNIPADSDGDTVSVFREVVRVLRDEILNGSTSRGGPGRRPIGGGPRSPADHPASLFDGIDGVYFHARGGTVVVSRGETELVRLDIASVDLEADRHGLRRADVRVGQPGSSGPSIDAGVVMGPGALWRADVNGDGLPLADLARWVPAVPWHGVDRGRARVRLRIEPGGVPGVISVDGEVAVDDFGLAHRRLAREPIEGLAMSVRGGAQLDLAHHRVMTEGVHVAVNGVTASLAGWAEHGSDRTAFNLALRLPTTDCDSIRRAMPATVAGPVSDLLFGGSIGADVHLALDTTNLPGTELDLRVQDRCVIVHDGLRNGVRRLSGPFVQRVLEPHGTRAFVTGPGSPAWVRLDDVSPYVAGAVLTREDGGFYHHHGFNVREIRGAVVRDVGARRFVYGASTITMQLAKNVFLAREKTLVRKLQEVVFTWYLEHTLDKDSILEAYLNVVEFGPGIYGIGPASRYFFGREPRDLSPLQAIYLATLLPNPVARFGAFERGSVNPGTLAGMRSTARTMASRGHLTAAEAAAAQTEVLAFRPRSIAPRGALTQTVDPSTTDTMAEDLSHAHAASRAVAEQGDDANDADDASEGDGAGGGATAPARTMMPVSVRAGGTI
jgi:hypothetical protein